MGARCLLKKDKEVLSFHTFPLIIKLQPTKFLGWYPCLPVCKSHKHPTLIDHFLSIIISTLRHKEPQLLGATATCHSRHISTVSTGSLLTSDFILHTLYEIIGHCFYISQTGTVLMCNLCFLLAALFVSRFQFSSVQSLSHVQLFATP